MIRRLLLLSLLLVPAIAALAAGPQIKFDDRSHDFGTIGAEGGPVTHVFHFTNTGDEPLIIISAKMELEQIASLPPRRMQALEAFRHSAAASTVTLGRAS